MPDRLPQAFAVFNEIGILAQLSRAAFEARLPDGVVLPQFSVLNHLIRVADGRTLLDLARAFQVPKTTMSHTVATLEKRGWVALKPNPDDGRSKRVWITPEGRAFRGEAVEMAGSALGAMLRDVPEGTMEAVLPHLVALRETLDAARDRDGRVPAGKTASS